MRRMEGGREGGRREGRGDEKEGGKKVVELGW